MLLAELFGEHARIKILEELVSNWNIPLTVDEIARMSDLSSGIVQKHLDELKNTGILISDNDKFQLGSQDERALSLALIESSEYLRRL